MRPSIHPFVQEVRENQSFVHAILFEASRSIVRRAETRRDVHGAAPWLFDQRGVATNQTVESKNVSIFVSHESLCIETESFFFFFLYLFFHIDMEKFIDLFFVRFFFRNSKAILIPCFFFALNF